MIREFRTALDMFKSIKTSLGLTRLLLLCTLLTISISWTGCKTTVRVISADQQETFLKSGQPFTAPVDGVFMPDARYQRYRRVVADKIQAAETPAK